MKQPASYRVLKYWKSVDLEGLPFHTTYMIVPETKVRSDSMPDWHFDAIVTAVKNTDVTWVIYTIDKALLETNVPREPS